MQGTVRKFLAPPVFPEDNERTRSAAILNIIGWITIFVLVLILIFRMIQGGDVNLVEVNLVLVAIIGVIGVMLYLIRRGYIRIASLLLVGTTWIGLSYVTWVADGIRDVAFAALAIPIMLAGLLLGLGEAIFFTLMSILLGWALAYAETNRLFITTLDTPLHFARDMTAVFGLIGMLIYLTVSSLQNALRKSQTAARELSRSNKELSDLRVDLEQRVEKRTSELTKRAAQFEAVSSVARTIASVQDLEALLPAITKLVSQQFSFYHVGIFLLDDRGEHAILRASNSEGGLRMINQHHRLPLDHHSIVGYATSRGEPRIALDVGTDSVYFNNPELPDTCSEIALPLRVAGRVIGAIDVQSTETNAFSQEAIDVLATLADQVAIAIENARLFGEAQRALNESRAMFEKYTQQEWTSFVRQIKQPGYVFDGKQVVPLDNNAKREAAKAAAQTGRLSLKKESDSIAIPIKLRGQTIGVLDVRSKRGERQWKQDEITLLEAAAERAALALENARLVESAQRRAARERAIGDISAKIGAVSNLESILQAAVEELGRKIGATEVSLEISSADGQNGS
ncbi:MAG TPA: GAF domain-containing protein [Anaerolineales bacterium]|nr:GAF domain-containing protein [Anaerolineales bacterium]HLO28271.1 GAF domain-containing protein [Anaerolineales bacterium]